MARRGEMVVVKGREGMLCPCIYIYIYILNQQFITRGMEASYGKYTVPT